MNSIELFAGAGGLGMGMSRAGYRHKAVVEFDRHCCSTLRENKNSGASLVADWPLFELDVASFDYQPYEDTIDLLAGGVPCQPWSLGGKHRGYDDRRNLFPEMFRAVRELRPKAVLVENVKGLMRKSFANYVQYIRLCLSYPELSSGTGESWEEHLSRLERHHTKGKVRGLEYNVVVQLLNAADFGVPQKRERVFFTAFRTDLGVEWSFPRPTHSLERLMHDKWVTGEYWEKNGVPRKLRQSAPSRYAHRLGQLKELLFELNERPWLTVREALSDLPDPSKKGPLVANHNFQPGAKPYKGHTGSPLDEPAKTLKAGDHGVPGGENMMVKENGSVRYFTVRESARLQTFPDDFTFGGSWTENMRQLGNAVPVRLAEYLGLRIRDALVRSSNARLEAT